MIDILGIGWLNDQCYGQGRIRRQIDYAGRVPLERLGVEDNIFQKPVKNFGRFEPVTQKLCIVTALSLQDAGLTYGEKKLEIGLLAIHKTGCIASNRRFFQDYLDGGRTLSRANLFIYTLPSSPCAEAAICFGLRGPLLYMDTLDDSMDFEIRVVENLLRTCQAEAMLIYLMDEPCQVALVVGTGSAANEHVTMSSIPKDIAESVRRITEALREDKAKS